MAGKSDSTSTQPDARLHEIVEQVRSITEDWARQHDLWHDAGHHDPIKHSDTEPGSGSPLLLFWSEGDAMRLISHDEAEAKSLRDRLEEIGVFMEQHDNVTSGYYLIDNESELQRDFDRLAQWKWTCRLIEADTADVSGDIYQWFAENPSDFRRLPPREFEKLISSIFTARGWRTEVGPGSGDKGVDVRMWMESPLGESLTLVQAKRYAPKRAINLEAVAALEAHSMREEASALFVTTSRYLPGVRDWAQKNKNMMLADSSDLQEWCRESAEGVRKARNLALAMEAWEPLIHQIVEARGSHPRLVIARDYLPSFCVVLKETASGALLVNIPSIQIEGDYQAGQMMPVLDGSMSKRLIGGETVFRCIREVRNGRVSYWGKGSLYYVWDGRPAGFQHWD